VFINELKTAK